MQLVLYEGIEGLCRLTIFVVIIAALLEDIGYFLIGAALAGANFPDALQHLRAAQHNEYQEWEHDYAEFARVAEEEGFQRIGKTFSMISGVEQTHGDRFGLYADLLEQGKLFVADSQVAWMCLNCGYIFEGAAAPKVCPVCQHDQGFFVRLEMAPFGDAVLKK